MKIVKITGGYVPAEKQGGTAVVAHALSRALRDNGHEVLVLTSNANGDDQLPFLDEWREVDGVPVFYGNRKLRFLPIYVPSLIKEFKKKSS